MTRRREPVVEPGQIWASNRAQRQGWRREVMVEELVHSVVSTHVLVRPLRKDGRRSQIDQRFFGRDSWSGWSFRGHWSPWGELMPPLPGRGAVAGCGNAGTQRDVIDGSRVLAVGFGFVTVWRDGETIWCGDDEDVKLRRFEKRAAVEGGDWRVHFYGPLWEGYYQRQGLNEWVLVRRGMGFA